MSSRLWKQFGRETGRILFRGAGGLGLPAPVPGKADIALHLGNKKQ